MKGRAAIQLKRYGRSFAMVLVLMAAGTAAGFYILLQERLPNPFQRYYTVNAAFPTAAGVVPGLGEPVNVAGVRVGEVANTYLKNGQGIIEMDINPNKLPQMYGDAHAALVPNTPLKDMEVNIDPGRPSAGVLRNNATIGIAQTTSPTDSDELLDAVDADTRTWFTSLITELNNATTGRGQDIRNLLRTLGPTSAQIREISDLLASRRHQLSRIVHNLGVLAAATNTKNAQLQTVLQAGDTTVKALASQDVALRQAVVRLPGTLATTRKTLGDVTGFAQQLGPTATALLPTTRHLPSTLRAARTLFQGAALFPADQVDPFINAVLPLARQLTPLTADLKQEVPELIKAFKVVDYAVNEIAYNGGVRNPGFLYWLAWTAHNTDSATSVADAQGPAVRGIFAVSCGSLRGSPAGPLLEAILGTTFGC